MSKRGVSFQRIFDAMSVGWGMEGGGGWNKIMDQYQYLGNCPPTPPLAQH